MSEHEPELTVSILNLCYKLRGFDAIRDLKLWLDDHASECNAFGGPALAPTSMPPDTPQIVRGT